MFFDNFSLHGTNAAAIDENGNQVTYAELDSISNEFSKHAESRKLVLSFCNNTLGSLCGYLSFLKNRVVPLMVSYNIDFDLAQNLIDTYRPVYLYLPTEMKDTYPDCTEVFTCFDYSLLKTNVAEPWPLNNELGLLLTTSGSVGSAKLVRQSYENIQANTESIIEYLGIDANERPITTLPMNYTYGLSIINTHICAGATVLLTTAPVVNKLFWDFFKSHDATSFGGVPFTYEMLKKVRFMKMDLPSLKTMTQAGGKLSPELHKEFAEYAERTGKRFFVMYGQTEATARMSYLPAEKSLEKYGSMGIAIPGGKLELIDVDGSVITETDKVGELVYYGKNVTLGYGTCGEDLALGDERNGRLETGDMAKFDKDGYFFVTGRKKRFLKLYGNRVNLDEVDQMVKTQFNVDCASSGTDDLLKVFVTDTSVAKEDIITFLAAKTNLNARAFAVEYIDEIPRNDSGKVQYAKLPQ